MGQCNYSLQSRFSAAKLLQRDSRLQIRGPRVSSSDEKEEAPFDLVSSSQESYYRKLYEEHGYSPMAVASGQQIYKDLRYDKLSQVFEDDQEFSVHDVGMGLGHYYEYLKTRFPERRIHYSGSEVVREFRDYCDRRYPESKFFHRDLATQECTDQYDYLVFGGTFYHPNGVRRGDWERCMFRLLSKAYSMCRKGVSFNVITQYCDFYERDLYYCNMASLTDFIVSKMSRFFKIDHAYPLYELTVSVYRPAVIEQRFGGKDFQKYFRSRPSE